MHLSCLRKVLSAEQMKLASGGTRLGIGLDGLGLMWLGLGVLL